MKMDFNKYSGSVVIRKDQLRAEFDSYETAATPDDILFVATKTADSKWDITKIKRTHVHSERPMTDDEIADMIKTGEEIAKELEEMGSEAAKDLIESLKGPPPTVMRYIEMTEEDLETIRQGITSKQEALQKLAELENASFQSLQPGQKLALKGHTHFSFHLKPPASRLLKWLGFN